MHIDRIVVTIGWVGRNMAWLAIVIATQVGIMKAFPWPIHSKVETPSVYVGRAERLADRGPQR